MRYQKLSRVKLGTVPEADWGPYLRDLVALEPALVFGDAIGYAGEYPFRLQVKDDTLLYTTPWVLPPHQRDWVHKAMGKMEELGLVRKALSRPHPTLQAPSNSTYLDDCTVGAGKEATGTRAHFR